MADLLGMEWPDTPLARRRPWRPITVDVEVPLTEVDTQDGDALHVTVFAGPTPLGRVVIPTTTSVCTVDRLRAYTQRFDAASFADSLRRSLDEPTATSLSATVVICTRDRAARLRECLASLEPQRANFHDVIVVHNSAEDDGTEEAAAAFGARYVREPHLGLDRARNRGVIEARTDIVIFTDDDVRVHADWARRLVAGFIRTFDGLVLDGALTPPASAGRAGAGASMAFRRSFLTRIGGFPESLDAGQPTETGGDTYALYQALRHGHRVVFEPRAVVFHTHRTTPGDALRTVHGYATGVVAYLLHAAIEDRDPAPAAAAVRWARSRLFVFAGSVVSRPRATAFVNIA